MLNGVQMCCFSPWTGLFISLSIVRQCNVYLYKDWIVLMTNQLSPTEESVDLMRVKSSPIQSLGQYDQEEPCLMGYLCLDVGEHLLVEISF